MTFNKIIEDTAVVVVAIALVFTILHFGKGNGGTPTFGAAGSLQAENYIPYVRINGGYNSAMPIVTTSTLGAGATTLTGALIGTTAAFSSTGSFAGLLTTDAGILQSYPNATTTMTGTETLVLADVQGYNTVLLTPNIIADTTLTLFASSTATTWLPTAGDMQRTCFLNATTTANVYYVLAGGTGTNLLVASSSVSALGSVRIGPQKMGCIDFVRGLATPTTFDIYAGLTVSK